VCPIVSEQLYHLSQLGKKHNLHNNNDFGVCSANIYLRSILESWRVQSGLAGVYDFSLFLLK
jgi:hypothetical protein